MVWLQKNKNLKSTKKATKNAFRTLEVAVNIHTVKINDKMLDKLR